MQIETTFTKLLSIDIDVSKVSDLANFFMDAISAIHFVPSQFLVDMVAKVGLCKGPIDQPEAE